MPSQQIIPACSRIVQQQLMPQIPPRWQHQFRFGVQALTLKPFASLASNARQTVAHPDTAGTKMDRLTGNEGLACALTRAVAGLGYVKPTSLVACDHSDFNGLSAFVGAVQTRKGRAVPCLVEATYSLKLPAHKDAPKRKLAMRRAQKAAGEKLYQHVARTLEAWAVDLGFWPRLVFDRGFGGMPLVRVLSSHDVIFYVRLHAGRQVLLGDTELPVRELATRDTFVHLKGLSLRVVRSDDPETGEPWYILTSDMLSTRDQIIRIYYHRFEIEETFKDIKHVLELESVRFMKPLSLKVVLWFASLSVILTYLVNRWAPTGRYRHRKKRLSHYRRFFENVQREAYNPLANLITGGL